jgi:phosphatidylglycerophosphate synthase
MLKVRDHIRPFHLEEPFDYFLFRPLALVCLNFIHRYPISPNHVSVTALLVSLASGFALSRGSSVGFVLGGLGILIFSVLDCCDGMLARLRQSENLLGEPLDVFVDIASCITFFVCLAIGFSRNSEWSSLWFLPILSGLVIMVHASLYQGYKKLFCLYRDGKKPEAEEKLERYRAMNQRLQSEGGSYFARFLVWIHLRMQKSDTHEYLNPSPPNAQYVALSRGALSLRSFTGGSNHLGLLGIALILGHPKFFFVYSFSLSQVILVFSLLWQLAILKKIRPNEMKLES